MNFAIQILENSGLGDKGAGLMPEQDIILRAAPCSTRTWDTWSLILALPNGCRVETGFPPIPGDKRVFQGRVVPCSPSSPTLPLPCPWL